ISAAVFSPFSSSRSATTTDAPSAANPRAYASPMPPAAPVTIATFPSNLFTRSRSCGLSCGLGDGLGLEVLLEAGPPHLPADSGRLVAAEGHVAAVPDAAVDAHGAGAHPPGHGPGPLGIARVDGAGEAVGRVVGDADGVVVAVVGDGHEHRAEDLLAGDAGRVVETGDEGGLDEEALVPPGRAPSAGGERAALLGGQAQVALHPLPLAGRDQGPADGAGV